MPRSAMVLLILRIALLGEAVVAPFYDRLVSGFIALAALTLTFVPRFLARGVGLRLPASFLAATAAFVFATIFLGEALDFYYRFWWWDMVLHFGSAMGFGLLGFLGIFMMFEGDRYAAPPLAIGILSFCAAMTVGVLWELFEFAMDQLFGFNMQKSGLTDTMGDLIVNAAGALIAGLAGGLYMAGRPVPPFAPAIDEFIEMNSARFSKRSDGGA